MGMGVGLIRTTPFWAPLLLLLWRRGGLYLDFCLLHLIVVPFIHSSFPELFPFLVFIWKSQNSLNMGISELILVTGEGHWPQILGVSVVAAFGALFLWDVTSYYMKIGFCGQLHLGNDGLHKFNRILDYRTLQNL